MKPHVFDSSTTVWNQEVTIKNYVLNIANETEQHQILSENYSSQDSFHAKLEMMPK